MNAWLDDWSRRLRERLDVVREERRQDDLLREHLTERIRWHLLRAGVLLHELPQATDDALLSIRGIGPRSLDRIHDAVAVLRDSKRASA